MLCFIRGEKNLVAGATSSFTGKLPWIWLGLNDIETNLIFQTGTSWTSGPTFSVPIRVLELADIWSYILFDEERLSKQACVFCSILVSDRGLDCCLIFCVVKCQQMEWGCVPIQDTDPKVATCQWARKQLFSGPWHEPSPESSKFGFLFPHLQPVCILVCCWLKFGSCDCQDYRK